MQARPERGTPETYNNFLAELKQEADEAYRLFNEKLLASELPTLGLRLPFLRKTAKAIAKGDPRGFLAVCGKTYHEERLLYGLVAAELPYADFCLTATKWQNSLWKTGQSAIPSVLL